MTAIETATPVPEIGRIERRLTVIYRIAELVARFRVEEEPDSAGRWHVLDVESGKRVDATYSDQAAAQAGMRMAIANAVFDYMADEQLQARTA